MNDQQLDYVILKSTEKLLAARSRYGFSVLKDYLDFLIVCIVKDVLNNADWYSLSQNDIVTMRRIISKTMLNNKYFMFDVPVTGIYSNFSDPQTSFTYDEIR